MKHEMKFYGKSEDKKFKFNEPELFAAYMKTLNGNISISVKEVKRIRNTQQNNLYWVYVSALAQEFGYSPVEMHDSLKAMFNADVKIHKTVTGGIAEIKIIKSTTGLTTSEFAEYMTNVIRFAAENGIVLPENPIS